MVDEELPPPRVEPRLLVVPAIRELYWCDLPKDAQLPEFWKRRPVIVVSFKNTLRGAVTVIPCSSQDQAGNPWAYALKTTLDGKHPSWAICDKPTTVAVSRLTLDRIGKRRLPEAEFNGVLTLLLKWLPVLPSSLTKG
jgi:mRNA interferase MazF